MNEIINSNDSKTDIKEYIETALYNTKKDIFDYIDKVLK